MNKMIIQYHLPTSYCYSILLFYQLLIVIQFYYFVLIHYSVASKVKLQNIDNKMFGAFYNKGQLVLKAENGEGSVWISGYDFAHNVDELKKNNIFAVCSGVELGFKYPEGFHHLKFDLDDSHVQQVNHVFEPAFQFIDSKRKQTNVLVHCAAGISRCSVLLISYMMKKYQMNFEDSLKIVKAARPCVQPNMGFVKQLKQYEKTLKNSQKTTK